LTDAECLREQCVLSSLPFSRESSFKPSYVSGQYQKGYISLGCPCDHVFDEVSVSRCVDDGLALGLGNEFEDGAVDGDSALTFSL